MLLATGYFHHLHPFPTCTQRQAPVFMIPAHQPPSPISNRVRSVHNGTSALFHDPCPPITFTHFQPCSLIFEHHQYVSNHVRPFSNHVRPFSSHIHSAHFPATSAHCPFSCSLPTDTTNESRWWLVGVYFSLYFPPTPSTSHHDSLVCLFYFFHHQRVIATHWCNYFTFFNTTNESQWLVGVFILLFQHHQRVVATTRWCVFLFI